MVKTRRKPLIEIEAELGRLKRELAEVKMERDLLKKFATKRQAVLTQTLAYGPTNRKSLDSIPPQRAPL